ncbi:uncharacterized mitochondrial protein AtMg00810-like [Capsicum annuum]|uniref:uncharacterized mitochondrial protein AtMg00810-like n=1 Tax=Capsicum annuum TaxID=4072 RepID=UPI001FB1405C|nr:uncharacterized mitochondrial protein AtMg00810-like [Capsicum annuum]
MSKNEPTFYVKKQGKTDFLMMCLYVDDMIYMGSCESLVAEFKSFMIKKFEMTDLGLLQYFLGLEIKQSLDGIFVSQRKYATDLLRKLYMLGCKIASTPMNVNEKLISDDGAGLADARCFRRIVDGLNYLSHTRPDIEFSISVVSRFMHNLKKHHFGVVKRILRYIAETTDFGIWYSKTSDFRLFDFTDSDYAGCLDNKKSTSGYVFSLGSGVISWSSKKQEIMALSSSEAEYIAATASSCLAVWLKRLLTDVFQEQAAATEIFWDNKATISMIKIWHFIVGQSILTFDTTSYEIW